MTKYKVDSGPKRSPGDGDEDPIFLTSPENQPNNTRPEATSQDMRPIGTAPRTLPLQAGKSSGAQECLCKPPSHATLTPGTPRSGKTSLHSFTYAPRSLDPSYSSPQQSPFGKQERGFQIGGRTSVFFHPKEGNKIGTTSPSRRQSDPEGAQQ
ncbi:hypothetical protein SK128_007277, partial [Halocaridina rubra]